MGGLCSPLLKPVLFIIIHTALPVTLPYREDAVRKLTASLRASLALPLGFQDDFCCQFTRGGQVTTKLHIKYMSYLMAVNVNRMSFLKTFKQNILLVLNEGVPIQNFHS